MLNKKGGAAAGEVRVVFKPVYELIASLAVYLDNSLSKNSELGRRWVRDVKKSLPPSLRQLPGKPRKELSFLAQLLILEHDQPVHDIGEIGSWFGDMNVQKLSDYASVSSELVEDLMPHVKSIPETLELLEKWERYYFSKIDPAIVSGLAEEARRKQEKAREQETIDLVEEATCGIRLEDIGEETGIILAPQYHARPFNFFSRYNTLVIIQYPVDLFEVPGEPPPRLMRLTTALADPTRLKILQFLAQGERSFTEIVKNFTVSKSTIHYHLVSLRAAGLVRIHHKEKEIYRYSLRRSTLGHMGEALDQFLTQVEPGAG